MVKLGISGWLSTKPECVPQGDVVQQERQDSENANLEAEISTFQLSVSRSGECGESRLRALGEPRTFVSGVNPEP